MNKEEAIAHFTQKTIDCLADAAQRWPEIAMELAQTEIKFDIRAGRLLGQAKISRSKGILRIRYNLAAACMNPEKFAWTVPHEVAHIVCFLRKTDRGHGYAWKNTCTDLGGDGQRVCNGEHFPELKCNTRGTRYYRWTNAHGGQWMTKKEHTRLLSGDWARRYYGLTTFTAEKVMSKDEFRAARAADKAALRTAQEDIEAKLAAAQKVEAILKQVA